MERTLPVDLGRDLCGIYLKSAKVYYTDMWAMQYSRVRGRFRAFEGEFTVLTLVFEFGKTKEGSSRTAIAANVYDGRK